MQKKSSKPALETPQSPQPSVFQRARNRLLVGLGAGAKPPSPSPAAGPDTLLAKFYSLQGAAKTAFLRANREVLKAAEVAAPPSLAAAHKASPAPGYKPPSPSPAAGPDTLLAKFYSLQGAAKTEFFRANREALKAAEVAAPPSLAAAHKASPAPGYKPPSPSPAAGPESLLERFHSLRGSAKTAYFRSNKSLLKAAESAVDACGTASEDRVRRNFAVAQSQALPTQSNEALVESFHSLQGTAKTAFFRANYAALKLAAKAA